MESDAAGRLLDHSDPDRVPCFGRREDLPHLEGLLEHRVLSPREVCSELRQRRSTRVDVVRAAFADGVELAGVPVVAAVQLPVEHHSRPESRSDQQEREIRYVPGEATALLGDRGEVDVVLERHGRAERVLQLLPQVGRTKPRQIRSRHAPVDGGDDCRQRHHGVLQQVRGDLAGTQERTDGAGQRVDPGLDRAAAAYLLACEHLAG